jgi:hypothetical protein
MGNGLVNLDIKEKLLFIILCGVIFFVYNYDIYLFLRPQSVHFWRQTDSLAFISGYSKTNSGLLNPSVLNLQCGEGQSASEFPIFYYIISKIHVLFEFREIVLKLIYLFFYFFGLFSLFKLYAQYKISLFHRIVYILLISSSTVLGYYACNVVPDSCSFGLTLIGIFYYSKFKKENRTIDQFLFILSFSLAGLLKIQYLIYPIGILCSELFLLIRQKKLADLKKFFPSFFWLFIPITVAVIWSVYVINYNISNCSTCFLSSIQPIWNLTSEEKHKVWDSIINSWWSSYYYPTTFHLMFVVIGIVIIFFQRIQLNIRYQLIFTLIGCISYLLLFYPQFQFHDYYVLCFIPLIGLIFIGFHTVYDIYKSVIPRYIVIAGNLTLAIITLLSINYGRKKLTERYLIVEKGIETVSQDYYTLESYLTKLGIPSDALVVSIPDHTCNGTLYFMNRRGWTLQLNETSLQSISTFKAKGADYLIVNDAVSNTAINLSNFTKEQIGQQGKISIYKL